MRIFTGEERKCSRARATKSGSADHDYMVNFLGHRPERISSNTQKNGESATRERRVSIHPPLPPPILEPRTRACEGSLSPEELWIVTFRIRGCPAVFSDFRHYTNYDSALVCNSAIFRSLRYTRVRRQRRHRRHRTRNVPFEISSAFDRAPSLRLQRLC